ncbi:MAG: bifunctional DNA-formamidopyrimidine glycosylase/DNA-(apurinic or apyrimidinic site) lyase [Arcanobacterium sp.]|nr:bifunctional DNA-formamidopyrimidine glycosylase/DNA-(apurinic or apyrimidinic site) lyase [Arcanobacterium sp.]
MPELPEVESIRVGVAQALVNQRIHRVDVFHERAVREIPGGAAALASAVTGEKVLALERRGKFMWMEFAGHQALVIHLGMSGQLLVDDAAFEAATRHYPSGRNHERVRFYYDDGVLRFVDQRTFGFLALSSFVKAADGRSVPAAVAHIAPDALEMSSAQLARRLAGGRRDIKRILLDQKVVSGIGNIYADESLFRAGIHPSARQLGERRSMRLAEAVHATVNSALAAGGTSFDQLYRNASGEAGYFDRELAVYARAGEPCPRCGTPIRTVPFMGRHTHFCPHCQRR